MPNRILRDWTDSTAIDKLSWQEEVVFIRLIMKADDFGNFYRNSSVVKSLLFPRKEGLRPSDIDRWLSNMEAADLIRCYTSKDETYLHIRNFKQRLDRKSRKFPEEPAQIDDDNHLPQSAADGSKPPPEEKRNEVETEEEGERKASPPSLGDVISYFIKNGYTEQSAKKAWNYYETGKWRDSKGNKVKNWKQKMQAVWFKPDNEIPKQLQKNYSIDDISPVRLNR